MKVFIQSLIVTAGLIILFSVSDFQVEVFTPSGSYGIQYFGDSGPVLPGGGTDIAEAVAQPEADRMEKQELSENTDEANAETQIETEIQTEIKMEVQNKMGDMMLAFWHGVAAVLIGETAALMVAIAYLKIKKFGDGNG